MEDYAAYKHSTILGRARGLLYLSPLFLLLGSCSQGLIDPLDFEDSHKKDIIDPRAGLTREDYRALNELESYDKNADGKSGNIMEPPIPDMADVLSLPRPPKIGETKLVSVAVTDDVPLKDVLIELARLADVDIEVDAGVTGGVAFRAKDRPFNEVIARLADLGGLRYTMKNNVLRIERDTPYVHTYRLDLLNVERSASGNIGVSSKGNAGSSGSNKGSAGGATGGGTSSGGSTTGSSSNINAESKSDFWTKFEESITKILAYQPKVMTSATAIATQPNAAAPSPYDPNAQQNGAFGGVASAPTPAVPVPLPVPVASGSPGNAQSTVTGTFYSLNRQAGTLTVSASDRQHEIIRQFLDEVEANISSQVLIEAKIVEVSLSDRYQTGIEWNKFGENSADFTGDLDAVSTSETSRTAPTLTLLKDGLISNFDLDIAVKMLNEFGTARALSSPRLNAMNNQQAVLSFVENLLYFDIDIEVTDQVAATATSAGTPAKVEVTSTPLTAPVGIVLTLQPSINRDTNEITLSVRPTLSKSTKTVTDPGFEVGKAQAAAQLESDSPVIDTLNNIESKIPQLEVRELDSIMKVKSGQVMVIGGLLEDKLTTTDSGVPGVSEIPYFGNLFKSVDKTTTKKELVIMIRATIVGPHGFVDKADKGVYKKFMSDPRPLEF